MKIHEFQAKELFANAGVAVLQNRVATTAAEAAAAFEELGTAVAVVKAQIHAGGRGSDYQKTRTAWCSASQKRG